MCRVNGPAKETHPDPETRASEIYNFDSETGAEEIHPDSKTKTRKHTLILNPEPMKETQLILKPDSKGFKGPVKEHTLALKHEPMKHTLTLTN